MGWLVSASMTCVQMLPKHFRNPVVDVTRGLFTSSCMVYSPAQGHFSTGRCQDWLEADELHPHRVTTALVSRFKSSSTNFNTFPGKDSAC